VGDGRKYPISATFALIRGQRLPCASPVEPSVIAEEARHFLGHVNVWAGTRLSECRTSSGIIGKSNSPRGPPYPIGMGVIPSSFSLVRNARVFAGSGIIGLRRRLWARTRARFTVARSTDSRRNLRSVLRSLVCPPIPHRARWRLPRAGILARRHSGLRLRPGRRERSSPPRSPWAERHVVRNTTCCQLGRPVPRTHHGAAYPRADPGQKQDPATVTTCALMSSMFPRA
jgi:hypothetical protein